MKIQAFLEKFSLRADDVIAPAYFEQVAEARLNSKAGIPIFQGNSEIP